MRKKAIETSKKAISLTLLMTILLGTFMPFIGANAQTINTKEEETPVSSTIKEEGQAYGDDFDWQEMEWQGNDKLTFPLPDMPDNIQGILAFGFSTQIASQGSYPQYGYLNKGQFLIGNADNNFTFPNNITGYTYDNGLATSGNTFEFFNKADSSTSFNYDRDGNIKRNLKVYKAKNEQGLWAIKGVEQNFRVQNKDASGFDVEIIVSPTTEGRVRHFYTLRNVSDDVKEGSFVKGITPQTGDTKYPKPVSLGNNEDGTLKGYTSQGELPKGLNIPGNKVDAYYLFDDYEGKADNYAGTNKYVGESRYFLRYFNNDINGTGDENLQIPAGQLVSDVTNVKENFPGFGLKWNNIKLQPGQKSQFRYDVSLVPATPNPVVETTKTVKNITNNTDYANKVVAAQGDKLGFKLETTNSSAATAQADNVIVSDDLSKFGTPTNIVATKEDGTVVPTTYDEASKTLKTTQGSTLKVGEKLTITFEITLDDNYPVGDVVNKFVATYNATSPATGTKEKSATATITVSEKIEKPKASVIKTYKNNTSNDGKIRVGDELEFDVTATTTNAKSLWKNVSITDQITDLVDAPYDMTATASNGSAVTGTYTAGNRTITTADGVDLKAGETLKLNFKVKVNSTAVNQAIVNKAVAEGKDSTGSKVTADATVTTPLVEYKNAVAQVKKTVENATSKDNKTRVGDQLDYVIEATNIGEDSLWKNVVISDTLTDMVSNPFDMTAVSTSGENISVVWDETTKTIKTAPGANLTEGQKVTLKFSVQVTEKAVGQVIKNTAHAEGENPDGGENGGEGEPETELPEGEYKSPKPDLIKTYENLSRDEEKVVVGDTLKYTVRAKNLEDGSLWSNVVITDKLTGKVEAPTDMKVTTSNGTEVDATFDPETRTIVTTPGVDLLGQETMTLVFTVVVEEDAVGEQVINTAEAVGSNPNDGEEKAEVTTPAAQYKTPEAKVIKTIKNLTSGDESATVGDELEFTINAKNYKSGSIWRNVFVSDELSEMVDDPYDVTVSTSNGTNMSYTYDRLTRTLRTTPRVDLLGNQEINLTFKVKINEKAVGNKIENTALGEGEGPGGEEVIEPGEPGGELPEPGFKDPKAQVIKSVENKTSTDGKTYINDELAYTIEASNIAPDSIWKNVVVSDILTDYVTEPISMSATTSNGTEVSAVWDAATRTIKTDPKVDLKANEKLTLKFSVKVTEKAVGNTIKNTATAEGEKPDGGEESGTGEPGGELPKPEYKLPDPEVTKTMKNLTTTDGKTRVDDELEYKVIAKNNAADSLWKDVVISDTLTDLVTAPYEMTATASNGEVVRAVYDSRTKTIKTAPSVNLKENETLTLVFKVKVTEKAVGESITNTAVAEGENGGDEGKPETELPDPEYKEPKATISKTVENITSTDGKVRIDDELVYNIETSNTEAGSIWKDVVINDIITDVVSNPYEMTATASNGSTISVDFDEASRELTTAPAIDLKGNEKINVTFKVKVNANALGQEVSNTATAKGTTPNGDTLKVSANTDGQLEGSAGFKDAKPEVVKTVENKTSTDGKTRVEDQLDYKIVATNTELNSLWKNVVVSDTLTDLVSEPFNMTATTSNGQEVNVVWDAATKTIKTDGQVNLKGEESLTLSFSVKVTEKAIGSTIKNTASATGENPDGGENGGEGVTPEVPTPEFKDPKPEVKKSVVNNSSKDGKTTSVSDELEYKIVATNKEELSLWKNVTIKDELSEFVSAPYEMTATASNGEKVKVNYNSRTHTIKTTPAIDLKGNESITVTFKVKVTEKAVGQVIKNTAQAAGEKPGGEESGGEGEPETELPAGSYKEPKLTIDKSYEVKNSSFLGLGIINNKSKLDVKVTIKNNEAGSIWKNVKIDETLSPLLSDPTNVKLVHYKDNSNTRAIFGNSKTIATTFDKNTNMITNDDTLDLKGNEELVLTFKVQPTEAAINNSVRMATKAIGYTAKDEEVVLEKVIDLPVEEAKDDTTDNGNNNNGNSNGKNDTNSKLPETGTLQQSDSLSAINLISFILIVLAMIYATKKRIENTI